MKRGLLLFVMLLCAACSPGAQPANQHLAVVATIFPLYDIAREMGGQQADVRMLLLPGVDAHTYEPVPSDIVKMTNSDVFIYMGAGMEPFIGRMLAASAATGRLDVEASKGVQLLPAIELHDEEGDENDVEDDHGLYDPHVWLDLRNVLVIVDNIASVLSAKDPANAVLYGERAAAYKSRIVQLDDEFTSRLQDCKHRVLISAGHNAFAYFGKRYGVRAITAYGISPERDPTPQDVRSLVDITKGHGIRFILVERMVRSSTAQLLAQEVGAEPLVFNPGQNVVKEEFDSGISFIEVMRRALDSIATALECKG